MKEIPFKGTRNPSIGMLVIEGRLRKTWALSGRKLETWLCGMWRKLRCLMTLLPLLVFNSMCSSHTAQVSEGKGGD